METAFYFYSPVIKQEKMFHGSAMLSGGNKIPELNEYQVFCASSLPLGKCGIYGLFNVHAHFAVDVYSEKTNDGDEGRTVDEGFLEDPYYTSAESISANVKRYKKHIERQSEVLEFGFYDEAFCTLIHDQELVFWYRDFGDMVSEPIDGAIPLSKLLKEINFFE